MGTTVATVTPFAVVPHGAESEPVSARVPTSLSVHTLVEENADFVFRVLRRSGLDEATSDDATQQVFLIAARKLPCIELGKEKGFLYAAAMNVAAQFKRRVARLGEVEFSEDAENDAQLTESDAPSLDELLDQRRARELLDEVLAALPEKLRDVFILSEIEELAAPEVAACLDIPPGTVASRLLRARELFDQNLHRLQARRAFRGGTR